MAKRMIPPPHTGTVLLEDFLKPVGITSTVSLAILALTRGA